MYSHVSTRGRQEQRSSGVPKSSGFPLDGPFSSREHAPSWFSNLSRNLGFPLDDCQKLGVAVFAFSRPCKPLSFCPAQTYKSLHICAFCGWCNELISTGVSVMIEYPSGFTCCTGTPDFSR
jgi:hypothetical protein